MTIFLGESQDLWVQVFFQTDNRLRNIFTVVFYTFRLGFYPTPISWPKLLCDIALILYNA